MLVRCLRASLLFVLLLFPALTFQSDLDGPNIRIAPVRSRENRPSDPSFPEPTLRVDSSLVLIPAQVTTREGSPIMDLTRKDFRIYEDGAEQKITYFAKDDAPVSIGLLLDSSGSMKNKKKKESEAAAAFFRTANAEDEFFLIEFDNHPKLAVPFTGDTDLLYRQDHPRPSLRPDLAVRCDSHGAGRDEESPPRPEGAGDHFRWRRQSQPPHLHRDQGRCTGSRRSALCDGDLRS